MHKTRLLEYLCKNSQIMETRTSHKHINRLLLDPNNYRFVDRPGYVHIDEKEFEDSRIQARTAGFLRGQGNELISDLINSFKTNGILQQDPIQVSQVGDNYVVIEGNRRVATLKYLYEQFKNNQDTGVLQESDFKSIEVIEIAPDNRRDQLVAMGLNHISGKKRWSPINQTRLIQDLISSCNMSEEEVCNALAISKTSLRRSLRTLKLIEEYRKSDYGDQFETTKYSIFEEIMKNTAMKEWLAWNDATQSFDKRYNLERLFSWISYNEVVINEGSDEEQIERQEPIITKSHEIRELAKFITDTKAIDRMEESQSVTVGFSNSDAIGESRFHNALDNIGKELDAALKFCEYSNDSDISKFNSLRKKFDRLTVDDAGRITPLSTYVENISDNSIRHFSSIDIISYRRIRNLQLTKLRNINLIVGGNNSGKTSLLEAVYILTKLNDLNAFLDLERMRGKFYNDYNAEWIDKNFCSDIKISGIYNDFETSVAVAKVSSDENIDRTGYVTSLEINASANNNDYDSQIHLYTNREPGFFYRQSRHLCNSAITSPYRYSGDLLRSAHAHAVKEKRLDNIVEFIRKYIDNSIVKIELVNIHGHSRFFVSSSRHSQSIDLTKYGEGLQRIFEIALLTTYCRNGILMIDEIDSAIHKGLLQPFANFISELARNNYVQLFISTHSKECVDAFSKTKTDEIMAYQMNITESGEIDYRRIDGVRLSSLIETINLEIR